MSILKTFRSFFNRNDWALKRYWSMVHNINKKESEFSLMSEEELKQKAIDLKKKFTKRREKECIQEALCIAREVTKRKLGMRAHDVQLIGSIVLYEGKIAEMATGEGKTLTASFAGFLNHISGMRTHIVTVNEYLVARDAKQLEPLYHTLGMTVSYVIGRMTTKEKRQAYGANLIYVTNHELGFDYLRDNTATNEDQQTVCGRLDAIIIDEIDIFCIDESRTPMNLSESGKKSSRYYNIISPLTANLIEKIDYEIDLDSKTSYMTDAGREKVEILLQRSRLITGHLYSEKNIHLVHYVDQCLKANTCFKRNYDYVVEKNNVILIDQITGRKGEGRRLSGGLHQAIEAKEGVPVKSESQTIATITYKNFFFLFKKKAGCSGTASTDSAEFSQVYKLDVITIPQNKKNIRIMNSDTLFKNNQDRLEGFIKFVEKKHSTGQPILIITLSVDDSDRVSKLLEEKKIPHSVLNARNHRREAAIIEEAGKKFSVVVSTAMAGRGTDIELGGSLKGIINKLVAENMEHLIEEAKASHREKKQEIIDLGGLCVVCPGRYEIKRSDNQSVGRCARQGEPGESKFFVSLEDEIFSQMKNDWVYHLLYDMVSENGKEGLTDPSNDKNISKLQKMRAAYYFDIRKQQLEYDNVIDDQRRAIYEQRQRLFKSNDLEKSVKNIFATVIDEVLNKRNKKPSFFSHIASIFKPSEGHPLLGSGDPSSSDESQHVFLKSIFATEDESIIKNDYFNFLKNTYLNNHDEKNFWSLVRKLGLATLDNMWRQYLEELSQLRKGVGLINFAQKEPLQEYKLRATAIFTAYIREFKLEFVRQICYTVLTPNDLIIKDQDDEFNDEFDQTPFEEHEQEEFETIIRVLKPFEKNYNKPIKNVINFLCDLDVPIIYSWFTHIIQTLDYMNRESKIELVENLYKMSDQIEKDEFDFSVLRDVVFNCLKSQFVKEKQLKKAINSLFDSKQELILNMLGSVLENSHNLDKEEKIYAANQLIFLANKIEFHGDLRKKNNKLSTEDLMKLLDITDQDPVS